jgi:hypothetical protein
MISWSRFLQPISRRKLAKLVLASPLMPVRGRGREVDLESSPSVNPWNHLNFNNNPDHFHFAILLILPVENAPEYFKML